MAFQPLRLEAGNGITRGSSRSCFLDQNETSAFESRECKCLAPLKALPLKPGPIKTGADCVSNSGPPGNSQRTRCRRCLSLTTRRSQLVPRGQLTSQPLFSDLLFDDAAVKEVDDTLGVSFEAWVMSDHANSSAFAVQFIEQLHHCFAIL